MLLNAHNPEVRVKETDKYTSRCDGKRTVVSAIIELLIKRDAEQRERKRILIWGGLEKVVGEHGSCKALE